MKNFQNKKHLQIVLVVLIAVVTLGIGYASITAINLFINGNATASVDQNNFDVHFVSTSDTPSLSGNVTPTGSASISQQDNKVALFDVGGMTKVGDYVIATYTILNNSNGIGAELSLDLTNTNNEYFKVTETVTDTQLQAGDTTIGTIKVEMIKTPIQDNVTTSVTGTLTATPMEDAGAVGNNPASKASDDPVSFATDSWATIKTAVHNNNTSLYHVGDTKTVTIGGNNYTVRIANKSTAANCGNSDYSETACGFVVEFAEVVEKRAMNSNGTNVGGWPGSELHAYLNGTFYNSLPSDLQAAIKPTRVISGHGSNDSTNFTSTDNLYLLSGVEVFGSDDYDTAAGTTHQLEFYQGMEADATTPWGAQAYSRTYKGYNGNDGSTSGWWLRPGNSSSNGNFRGVDCGYLVNTNAYITHGGLAPAFRIG